MDTSTTIMVGRLTRDAELRYAQSGTAIARFRLAVGRIKKDETDYWDVAVFGRAAEAVSRYLVRGKRVCVRGRLRCDTWERDGVRHERVSLDADDVQLLDGGDGAPPRGAPPVADGSASRGREAYDGVGDDVPF